MRGRVAGAVRAVLCVYAFPWVLLLLVLLVSLFVMPVPWVQPAALHTQLCRLVNVAAAYMPYIYASGSSVRSSDRTRGLVMSHNNNNSQDTNNKQNSSSNSNNGSGSSGSCVGDGGCVEP